MCIREDGHRVLATTVAALAAGGVYRTPDGATMMVVTPKRYNDAVASVVDLATGRLDEVYADLKLGHDKKDRLYASRFLNPATAPATADVPLVAASPADSAN